MYALLIFYSYYYLIYFDKSKGCTFLINKLTCHSYIQYNIINQINTVNNIPMHIIISLKAKLNLEL